MNREKTWKQFLETDENGKPVGISRPINGFSRRSFLAALGYTAAGAALMSCRVPEQAVVPYLKKPAEVTPGMANWYASTCGGCNAGCGTLMKVRDGRPIKLEGNPDHPVSKGGLCSVAHSLVFGLFDPERLKGPTLDAKDTDWAAIDKEVIAKLADSKSAGKKVRVLTPRITSPTSRAVLRRFIGSYEDAKLVEYEPFGPAAIVHAHGISHSNKSLPTYDIEKAHIVVGFEADFLGTWISPVAFTKAYSSARELKNGSKEMLKHIQFESRISVTGANADYRHTASPKEQRLCLNYLLGKVSADHVADSLTIPEGLKKAVDEAAAELSKNKGSSLVVCGSGNPDVQLLVNAINNALENYGTTVVIPAASEEAEEALSFDDLVSEAESGDVGALFMVDVNPLYEAPDAARFNEAIKKIPLTVSMTSTGNETSAACKVVCAIPHHLESWDDSNVRTGVFSISQPAISPLYKTRHYQESFMRWMGEETEFYRELQRNWKETLFTKQDKFSDFNDFWDKSLHDGVFEESQSPATPASYSSDGLDNAVQKTVDTSKEGYSLVLYQKPGILDGRFANSPWLQELPDPISKVTWDNYALVSDETASALGVVEGDPIKITKGENSIEIPVLIQPGQANDCLSVAIGYGRTKAGNAGNDVGVNAAIFAEYGNGLRSFEIDGITVAKSTAAATQFAKMQIEPSAHERPLIKEYSLAAYKDGKVDIEETEFEKLFSEHEYPEHKWGMAVDLSACTGCNACVLSCQAENNIPVVGKDEVGLQRDMHWLRIDRYFDESADEPTTRFQPLPCMHCENASCEMVCPVLATVHSTEGLNMQVYNRCVGTRYCANNCAYKVRRFNWFEYPHDDPTANLALNPDVTVRSRGVMEKCTMCVQRIEEKKIVARNENREIKDGEIQTACQQSCPANAIEFGDTKNLKSRVVALKKSGRNYVLLEDLNTKPAVSYLAKITNSEDHGEEH
ncbi:MAG: 4Fe-4S dicluster domain-containing protein [Pyrinomonadaceae bacterium]|nr:4Fe-4S dicluster domain-containing protein [Pyrinomonadaceae bacterium]